MEKDIVANLTNLGKILLCRALNGINFMDLRGASLRHYAVLWSTTPETIVETVEDLVNRKIVYPAMVASGAVFYVAYPAYHPAAVDLTSM